MKVLRVRPRGCGITGNCTADPHPNPLPQGEGAVSASRNFWLTASAMECADLPQPLAGRSPLLREREQSVLRGMSGWLLLPWNVPTCRSRSPDGTLSWGRGSSQCLAECLIDCFCHGCADLPQPLAGRSPLLGERVRVRAESINPGRIFPATPRQWPGFVHLRHHPSAPDGSASETP